VPLGSGNDLARALDLDLDPARALRIALEHPPRRIDLGAIGDRLFAGIAGVGFDGDVNRFVNERMRRWRGRWAYPYAVLRTLPRFRPPVLEIDADGGRFHGPAMLVALANSPFFGGGMRFAPRARMDDGRLDLILVERISKWKLIGLFPRVYTGSHLAHPRVRTFHVRQATLRADDSRTVFADGEPIAPVDRRGTPVEIRAGALAVIAPPAPVIPA
jgi:diacylglycerol kinase family enzyme